MKYMKLLETAPPLKAESLADGYRELAEFNGTVLAGEKTLLGAQFVTWAWDYDRRGVSNGHYYMEDYQTAKEDFTFRSGLMAREQVFDRERLEELRQAAQGFLCGEGPASYQAVRPGSSGGRSARAGVHPLRPVPGLPLPSPWLPLLEHRRGMHAD